MKELGGGATEAGDGFLLAYRKDTEEGLMEDEIAEKQGSQFHLSTLVKLMLIAGIFLGLAIYVRQNYRYWAGETEYGTQIRTHESHVRSMLDIVRRALAIYAEDNGGAMPEYLEDLYPRYLDSKHPFTGFYLLKHKKLPDQSDPRKILCFERRGAVRYVLYSDLKIEPISERELGEKLQSR